MGLSVDGGIVGVCNFLIDDFHLGGVFSRCNIKQLSSSYLRVLHVLQNLAGSL